MSHAILSPSSASRWMACPPSARFEEQFPDKSSVYADEGTIAHSLGELLIREKLGEIKKPEYRKRLAALETDLDKLQEANPGNSFSSFETMLEYCEDYAVFVIERFAGAQATTPDAKLFLEKRLDMSDYVPEGFGTSDAVIVADQMMETIDLKYGKGVSVSVIENKQQKLYALGALKDFDFIYDIREVRMTIYQPRIGNIESWVTTVAELIEWAETELKPLAELAFEGKGEYAPGPHCGFCKGKAVCKALADKNLELAKHGFADPNVLTEANVSEILQVVDMLTDWASAVKEYALNEAVNNGKKWPGYKIVEGRSNRKYTDADTVGKVLIEAGFKEENLFTKKLLSITNMEKEIGKKVFAEMVGPYVIKPQGKPTLAPLSDKRPEFTGVESAIRDFADIPE
jgi:hypothetical protein